MVDIGFGRLAHEAPLVGGPCSSPPPMPLFIKGSVPLTTTKSPMEADGGVSHHRPWIRPGAHLLMKLTFLPSIASTVFYYSHRYLRPTLQTF